MDYKKKNPSLPSNYVTLVQLQERWELKKREKEEQEQERRREEQRLKEEQDNQKQNGSEEICETNSKSVTRRPFRRTYRRFNGRTTEVIHPEPEEPEARVQAVVVVGEEIHDQERKSDDSKNKKKKKWKNKKKQKPKREEEVTGGTEQPAPEKVEKENIPATIDGERKAMHVELQWKRKHVAKGKVLEPEDHLMVEIGQKFEDLSMNRGKGGGKRRSRVEINGRRGRYRGSGRFNFREGGVRKPIDNGLVWVRKGEFSDGNVAVIRCSGGFDRNCIV